MSNLLYDTMSYFTTLLPNQFKYISTGRDYVNNKLWNVQHLFVVLLNTIVHSVINMA